MTLPPWELALPIPASAVNLFHLGQQAFQAPSKVISRYWQTIHLFTAITLELSCNVLQSKFYGCYYNGSCPELSCQIDQICQNYCEKIIWKFAKNFLKDAIVDALWSVNSLFVFFFKRFLERETLKAPPTPLLLGGVGFHHHIFKSFCVQ